MLLYLEVVSAPEGEVCLDRPSPYEKTMSCPYGSKRICSPGYFLGISARLSMPSLGPGQRPRAVEDSLDTNANQPRPCLPDAQWQSANRLWIRKPSVRHDLSRRCVGSSNRYGNNSTHTLGYVLQWDGCATGWSPLHHERNAAIRSVRG